MNSHALVRRMVPQSLRRAVWAGFSGLEQLQQRAFERRLGVSTRGHAYIEDFGLDATDRTFYEGCQWLPVRRALKALGPQDGQVLADLGSGKGQALLIAGELAYERLIGVELVDDLTQEARANVQRARPRLRTPDIELVTADVLEWPVPDDVDVVFLYCPFRGEVFHEAMRRIFASYDRRPRPLHLVYVFPWEHDWLMETGRVTVRDVLPAQWPPKPWWWRTSWVIVTYRVMGAREGGPGAPRLHRRFLRPRRAIRRWSAPNAHRFSLTHPGPE